MAGFSERAMLRSNFLSQDWRKAGVSPESASAGRKTPWRRERQPTPVFLPGEPHGQRSLAGYSA